MPSEAQGSKPCTLRDARFTRDKALRFASKMNVYLVMIFWPVVAGEFGGTIAFC